jgi:hypothetical protein
MLKSRGIQKGFLMKQKRRETLLDMPYIFQNFSGHAERTITVQTNDRTSVPAYRQCPVPFMDLFDVPKILPARLTRLLSHTLACELRCVPVGCSSHGLTVAMADPTNTDSVQRLEAVTGMAIFPVSCDEDDLNVFLTVNW